MKPIILFFSQSKMSEDKTQMNDENLYYYSNKGRQQTFNLDDLTTEELKKFEKMTERQRLKFITNFELQRDTPFQDSISLKPTMTEARNEKYGDYALLKAKLDEVEKILDQDKDYENNEKLSLLDEDGKIIPEYLEQMNYITEEDLKNCMKAFDLKDVSLGMLKKYYNRKIESIELPGIKTSFLEALKKFYKELYKKENKDDVMERKIDSSWVKFNPVSMSPTSLTTAMEDAMVDVNKELKDAAKELIPKSKVTDELKEAIKDYDWDKVSKITVTLNLNQLQKAFENYQLLMDMLNEMYHPPHKDVSTPLALPGTESKKPTIKVEEVPEDSIEEVNEILEVPKEEVERLSKNVEEKKEETPVISIPEKKKEEPLSTPPEKTPEHEVSEKTPEEKLDINSPAKRYEDRRREEEYVKEFTNAMQTLMALKNTNLTELKEKDKRWKSLDTENGKTLILENRNEKRLDCILQKDNNDIAYYYQLYNKEPSGKNGRRVYEGSFKQPYTLVYRPTKDQYEVIIYEDGNPGKIARKYTYHPNTEGNFTAEDGKNKATISFTKYGKGYKIKYTSGSIIDKIRDKFLKNVNKSIDDLKEEDKSLYSKLDSLESEIRELKSKLLNVESTPKRDIQRKDIPSPPLKPESFTFLEEILKPHKPLKPVKPAEKPAKEDEYSDTLSSILKKQLDERRKDIEYSEDSDDEIEWGEGVKSKKNEAQALRRGHDETTSKKTKRMEILDFLRSLD